MKNLITIDSLTVQYEGNKIIDNFSYEFETGKFYAVMGPSGIGKTSLINCIMDLIPYTGVIEFHDKPVISAVFQEDRLCEGMSVSRNLKLVCRDKSDVLRIPEFLSAFGLPDCSQKKVSKLSGGMKRRVAIIRALLAPHNLLIMDEPFKGLDEATKLSVMDHVRETTPDDTVIMITHDLSEAEFFNASVIEF